MRPKSLLIVGHAPSPNCETLLNTLNSSAHECAGEDVRVEVKSSFTTEAEEVLAADALILFTTENFGYMSGALKDFFERIYYPCLEQSERNEAKPYCLVVKAGLDGTGTVNACEKIIGGLKWRAVLPACVLKGAFSDAFIERCSEVGKTISAMLREELI